MIEESLLDMGQNASDNGNYDIAIVYYRRAIEADPGDPDAAQRLGHIFYLMSDFQSAANVYKTAIKYLEKHDEQNNELGILHLCLCEACLRLGYLGEAEEQVAKAAQFDIKDASLYTTQGNVCLALGQYYEALQAFEETIKLNPTAADGYLSKVKVYQKQEHFALAAETLADAQKLAPEDFDIEVALGSLATSMQEFEVALRHYQRASNLAPFQPITEYSLGAAYLNLGDYNKAKRIFEGILGKFPKDADSMYSLAIVEMEQGGEKRAISLLNLAISINSDNVLYYVLLTKAYLSVFNLFKALRAASMAKKLSAKQKL